MDSSLPEEIGGTGGAVADGSSTKRCLDLQLCPKVRRYSHRRLQWHYITLRSTSKYCGGDVEAMPKRPSAKEPVRCSQHRKLPSAELGVSCLPAVTSFFRPMSFPHSHNPLAPSNMSGLNVLPGARNVVVSGAITVAETVREVLF